MKVQAVIIGLSVLLGAVAEAAAPAIVLTRAPGPTGEPLSKLEDGFTNPPNAAKPRVWWHWLDGNVSDAGVEKDLAWLRSVGIGGVQNFDASLFGDKAAVPAEERTAYLSDEWRRKFRLAVTDAHRLGMEFAIAAAPGWSETGGPWVKPEQAMKKLVWSERRLAGGKRFLGILPLPPAPWPAHAST